MRLGKMLRGILVGYLAFGLAGMMGCVYDPERRSDSEEAQVRQEQKPPELPERPAEPRRGNIIRR